MSSDLQGQGTPVKVRKSSPNAVKQGPMKATMPIACVLKRSNNFKNVSPTPPYYWKNKISPDYPFDQKYSSSIIYKAKSRTLSGSNIKALEVMRKTASLDSVYKWSHDEFFHPKNVRSVNDTQTGDVGSQKVQRSAVDDYFVFRRNYSHFDRQDSVSRSLPSSMISDEMTLRMRAQSSLEGLNREVASLTYFNENLLGLNFSTRYGFVGTTPDGHKAPVRDLASPQKSVSSTSSTSNLLASDSPPSLKTSIIAAQDSSSEQDNPADSQSDDGTPLGTSPLPRQFTSDLAQTGGERVIIKARSRQTTKNVACETQLQSGFKLKPSSTSAFDILKPVAMRVEHNQRIELTEPLIKDVVTAKEMVADGDN